MAVTFDHVIVLTHHEMATWSFNGIRKNMRKMVSETMIHYCSYKYIKDNSIYKI